jgi:hypothetical protein
MKKFKKHICKKATAEEIRKGLGITKKIQKEVDKLLKEMGLLKEKNK